MKKHPACHESTPSAEVANLLRQQARCERPERCQALGPGQLAARAGKGTGRVGLSHADDALREGESHDQNAEAKYHGGDYGEAIEVLRPHTRAGRGVVHGGGNHVRQE